MEIPIMSEVEVVQHPVNGTKVPAYPHSTAKAEKNETTAQQTPLHFCIETPNIGVDEAEASSSSDLSRTASTANSSVGGGAIRTKKTRGKQKINIEFINDKNKRYTTFSKRKTGLMKKAYELSSLTGAEVMLLVASETNHVYTFATPKLRNMIQSERGKELIQTCLACEDKPGPSKPATNFSQTPPSLTPSSSLVDQQQQRVIYLLSPPSEDS